MAFGGRSQLKMSEETFDFVCTACAEVNKTVEAVKYCVECSGYCCQSCTEVHKKFPALKKHNLMEVNQVNQPSGNQAALPEFPTERCSIHKGKVMDMYCESHDAVGCYVCIAKDHKSCQDIQIHSIPDMIDTLFKLSDCKQTHSLLKDAIVSMDTESKSKTSQLQTLHKAKKEALDKVNTFEKALETILRRKAESSRQDIEGVYKQLESEIINNKRTTDIVHGELKTTNDKLKDSDGNRAQRFVCTKIAQRKIKEADDMKTMPGLQDHTDVTFIPDQTIIEYIRGLQGIGQVEQHRQRKKSCSTTQKNDLYKIKESRYINIKLPDDCNKCWSYGCCLTHDNQLIVTDCYNKKLKRIDIQKMSVVDYCTLDSDPHGVCCINKHEVAAACYEGRKIQVVSIQGKMTPTRHIEMSHICYGIAFNNGKLYVTDNNASLYAYDMTGNLLDTISQDNAGINLFNRSRHITFNENGNRMFVGDFHFGIVCFDGVGNYLSTIKDSDIKHANGVCVDGRGNVFVVGWDSHNVIQFSENGKKVGVVVKQEDGLHDPQSVYFHQGLNRMFVTMGSSDTVKMFELM